MTKIYKHTEFRMSKPYYRATDFSAGFCVDILVSINGVYIKHSTHRGKTIDLALEFAQKEFDHLKAQRNALRAADGSDTVTS